MPLKLIEGRRGSSIDLGRYPRNTTPKPWLPAANTYVRVDTTLGFGMLEQAMN